MKSNKIYEIECMVCHTKFLSHSPIARYCPPCKYKVMRQQVKESAKRMQAREMVQKQIEAQKKVKQKTMLRDMVIEAENSNMSYGQYVAMKEMIGNDISGL